MTAKIYNWERYWVSREGAFSFDYDGFLLPPSEDPHWRSTQRTGVLKFEDIASKACLVLLGEPGIGKTFAVNAQVVRRSSLHLNLGNYGAEQRLIDDSFGSAPFKEWAAGGAELHVFFDSFDECLLRLDNVAALIADEVHRLKNTRGLFFRIASRTAEWRTALEIAFRQKWGDDQVGAYELAPLTRDQVRSAAELEGIAADSFIQAVIDREVVSFAIKPLTLGLLFRIWNARGGTLPPTQKEIYEQGCVELCSDFNPDRETPRLRRKLSAKQRVAIAGHIAAATIFCKRAAIATSNRPAVTLETDLSLSELAQGQVRSQQSVLSVTIDNLRETFDTGLFTARGPDRLGWAHQTYAEFLASRYLEEQRISTNQILSLIQHPLDPERKVVPQLQETAAWIASNRREVFEAMLDAEPDALLRSDVGTADDSTKRELVSAVLDAADKPKSRSDWWKLRARYRKLGYGGLARQLTRRLRRSKEAVAAKIEAIDMAEACELRGFNSVLAEVALATSEDMTVRIRAADVVSHLGSDNAKRQLRPLALGKRGALTDEDLFGAALIACWPKFLTARELFRVLKESAENGTSRYSQFLGSDKLVSGIPEKDLPVALRWVEAQKQDYRPSCYSSLIHGIIARGAASMGQPRIRAAFVPALLSRLDKHDYSTGQEAQRLNTLLDRDSQLRRAVSKSPLNISKIRLTQPF